MKHTIELDVKDIQQLIAKEFDVKEEQVVVAIKKVYSGYGIGEHKDYQIYATVKCGVEVLWEQKIVCMKPLVDGAQSGIRSATKRNRSRNKEKLILYMIIPPIKRVNQNPTMIGNVLECPQQDQIIYVENVLLGKLFRID